MGQEDKRVQYNFKEKVKESVGIRFSLLFGSFFVFLIITSILTALIGQLPGSERDHLLVASTIQNILVFCVPAFLLARFCSEKPLKWLKLDSKINLKPILGVLIMYIISMPAMDWITSWNAGITFPESMSELEKILRNWEEQGTSAGQELVESQGFISLITGIIIVGVLTGFSEELFFRGGMQGILVRTGLGAGISVWLTAILFSALHFQFFGFIPRLLMGVFFGYLLVWTNDIKISAFAHILNNSMVMIIGAVYGAEVLTDFETSFYPDIPYLPFISLIASLVFLVFFRGYFFKNHKTFYLPWQKKQLLPPTES